MFDLRFFKIVRKIIYLSGASTNHYANEHEQHVVKTKQTPLYVQQMEEFAMMTPELQMLHLYVSKTYPVYFGMGFRMGGAAAQTYQTVY